MINARRKPDLGEIALSLSHIPLEYEDIHEALERIAEIGKQAMDSQACTLTFVNLENKHLAQAACAGFDEEFEEHMAGRKIKLGSSMEGDSMDFDLIARGEMIEKYDLKRDGQGIANPNVARRYDLNAALCCPLKLRGRLIGYFNHFSSKTDRFTSDHKMLMQLFAHLAVLTIAQLEHLETLTSRERLETLNEIMQEMTEARDVDALLGLILNRGLELVGCERGWISRLDYRTGELHIVAHRGELSSLRPLQPGQGITGTALQTEKPIRVDDVQDRQWQGVYEEYWSDTRSELAVPILISNAQVQVGHGVELGSKPIGVLNVESPIHGAFSQADENLLWLLACYAASMIERLELDHKLSRLAEIQQEMAGKQDWDDIIEIMLRAITNTLGYEYASISLVKQELKRIKAEYVIGIPEHDVEEFKRLADHSLHSNDIRADIVRSRQIEVPGIEDERFDPRLYKRFRHDRLIMVLVPMIVPSDNSVMGTVEAGYKRRYRKYIYEQDVRILKGFVDYTVRALEQRQRGLLDKISHELRAPVVGIRSNASFLQRRITRLEDNLIQRKFDDILMDCEILLFQVKELEHILGRTSPTTKIERTLVFRDIIIKTKKQLRPLVTEHGLDASKIEYYPADIRRINPLYVDKAKLNQVVYNLLINSIKYAEADPAKFTIRITVDRTRDTFIIKFKDWGIGVNEKYREKIFEEGFRAPEAISRYVTGSGMGLTIARQIARELGGDLILANAHKPTEFHLVLPKSLKEVPDDSLD